MIRIRTAEELPQSAGDRRTLAKPSVRLRRRATTAQVSLLQLEAGGLIALAPHCPRWASKRVDAITVQIDRALGREVVL